MDGTHGITATLDQARTAIEPLLNGPDGLALKTRVCYAITQELQQEPVIDDRQSISAGIALAYRLAAYGLISYERDMAQLASSNPGVSP